MNFVTSPCDFVTKQFHPNWTISGKCWLLGFDLGENTFPSDFPNFSFLFQLLVGTEMPLPQEKSPADWVDQTCQGKPFLGDFCKNKRGPPLSAPCLQLSASVSATGAPSNCSLADILLEKDLGFFSAPGP